MPFSSVCHAVEVAGKKLRGDAVVAGEKGAEQVRVKTIQPVRWNREPRPDKGYVDRVHVQVRREVGVPDDIKHVRAVRAPKRCKLGNVGNELVRRSRELVCDIVSGGASARSPKE